VKQRRKDAAKRKAFEGIPLEAVARLIGVVDVLMEDPSGDRRAVFNFGGFRVVWTVRFLPEACDTCHHKAPADGCACQTPDCPCCVRANPDVVYSEGDWPDPVDWPKKA
jgi:hypothetical protein